MVCPNATCRYCLWHVEASEWQTPAGSTERWLPRHWQACSASGAHVKSVRISGGANWHPPGLMNGQRNLAGDWALSSFQKMLWMETDKQIQLPPPCHISQDVCTNTKIDPNRSYFLLNFCCLTSLPPYNKYSLSDYITSQWLLPKRSRQFLCTHKCMHAQQKRNSKSTRIILSGSVILPVLPHQRLLTILVRTQHYSSHILMELIFPSCSSLPVKVQHQQVWHLQELKCFRQTWSRCATFTAEA